MDGQKTTVIRNSLNEDDLLLYLNMNPTILRTLESLRSSRHNAPQSSNLSNSISSLKVKQFGFGQSNPTYLIIATSHSVSTINSFTYQFVLRKKPASISHKTAHNVAREFKILSAIQQSNLAISHSSPKNRDFSIPIPHPIHLCTDPTVLGSDFYLMDFVEGRIFTNAAMPGMTPSDRYSAWCDAIRVLGNIHAFDWVNSPLNSRSTPTTPTPEVPPMVKSIFRLLSVYKAQSRVAGTIPSLPGIARKLTLLSKSCPGGGGTKITLQISEVGKLIHGDYKIDNLIFHPTEPRVIAVIDWEVSERSERAL